MLTEAGVEPPEIPDAERTRRDAIWEIFTNECTFLVDHLMVLKHVSSFWPCLIYYKATLNNNLGFFILMSLVATYIVFLVIKTFSFLLSTVDCGYSKNHNKGAKDLDSSIYKSSHNIFFVLRFYLVAVLVVMPP